jgi:ribosome biogenesis GTPase
MEKVQIGRIIEIYKDSCLIQVDKTVIRLLLPKKLAIVVGDLIKLDTSSKKEAQILEIKKRTSSLTKTINKKNRVVASNIHKVAILASSKPKISNSLVDKWLVLSKINKLEAIIIFNKSDREDFEKIRNDITLYNSLGIECFEVSTKYGAGINTLKNSIAKQSVALVGLSGVGKSSLIRLLTGADIKTQNLSKNTGRHTTTTTRLYDGPDFSLIDTPGAGDIDLENFTRLQITSGFHEIFSAATSCKFTNCSHASNEQGCNVLKMLNKGIIAQSRYENFMQEINGRK